MARILGLGVEGATLTIPAIRGTSIRAAALPPGFTLLQVTPRLEGGGVEETTRATAAAVAGAGARSLVASQGGAMEGALASAGAEFIRLPLAARDPVSIAVNGARLAAVVRREKVRLIHVRSRAPAFSALMAGRLAGAPVVATYHGLYSGGSPIKRWYNAVMTRGELVIAPSRYVADHIAAEHGVAQSRLAIVPDGVDTTRFDRAAVEVVRVAAVRKAWGLDASDRRRIILLAARFTRLKGHALAIEAFAESGVSDAVLVLAGPAARPAYARELAGRIARTGLQDRVRIPGPCADMPAALLASDLLIAPSLVAESFGRSVVEAGAMGVPVLAADLGGPAETVEDGATGRLVAAGDLRAWSSAIVAALTLSAQERAAMGLAARERVERLYGLQALREATFAAYRRVLEPSA